MRTDYKSRNENNGQRNSYSNPEDFETTNKNIVNAYNFVSLGNPENIKRGRCKPGNLTGKIVCTLKNLTPLFTGGKQIKNTGENDKHTKILFLCDSQNYIISASSLKGTIRNIIEVITTSCIKNVKEDGVPEPFKPCTVQDKLCFACRLFGSTGDNKKEDTEGNGFKNNQSKTTEEITNGAALEGRVFFTDGVLKKSEAKIISTPVTIDSLSSPSTDKKKYYYQTDSNSIRGRKFYWHHEDKIKAGRNIKFKYVKERNINSSIQYLKPDNNFTFEIGFKNLTDLELGVLIYSIELEKGMAHKMGMGKPLGLGTCEIKIEKLLLDSGDKYKSFTSPYKNGDTGFYKDMCIKTYMDDRRKEIRELKMILNKENPIDFSKRSYPQNGDLKNKNLPTILDYRE